MSPSTPPILLSKWYEHASLFAPENLLREARRQKDVPEGQVPSICLLDPDGDILDNLLSTNKAVLNPYWACYHTKLYNFEFEGIEFGIVACAVGASFAVLIAEELFAANQESRSPTGPSSPIVVWLPIQVSSSAAEISSPSGVESSCSGNISRKSCTQADFGSGSGEELAE